MKESINISRGFSWIFSSKIFPAKNYYFGEVFCFCYKNFHGILFDSINQLNVWFIYIFYVLKAYQTAYVFEGC